MLKIQIDSNERHIIQDDKTNQTQQIIIAVVGQITLSTLTLRVIRDDKREDITI